MITVRPEDQVLLCIARLSLDAPTARRLHELLRLDLDWDYLLAVAKQHGVLPLLYRHVITLNSGTLPPLAMKNLQESNHDNTNSSLFLTGELLKILQSLEANRIPVIPFKGPTLAVSAYGDLGLRQFTDLDLLVHKKDVLKVKQLLIGRGFKPWFELSGRQESALLQFDCAYNFDNGEGVLFDVHWKFAEQYLPLEIDTSGLWNRLKPLTTCGKQVLTLSYEDLLLILCLHGFTHRWERLGWICDVASLIELRKDIDWEALLQNAARIGCLRILRLGLVLAGDLLAAQVPREVWERLPTDNAALTLAAQIQKELFAQRDGSRGLVNQTLLNLRLRERWRDRIRSFFRLVATPRVYDWMLLPLPDSLFFLYYLLRPLRLAVKYGTKPLKRSPVAEHSVVTTLEQH